MAEDIESSVGTEPAAGRARAYAMRAPLAAAARNLLLSCAGLIGAFFLARAPQVLDRPAMRAINGLVGRSRILDMVLHDLDRYATFSGVILMAVACGVWMAATREEDRARILTSILLAFPVGILSRLTQHLTPTHPRPYWDPNLNFHPPNPSAPPPPYNTWNSFPSDHATVFGMLLFAIWMVRPKLGPAVAVWYVVVEFARIYVGAHYPSDILGGVALAGIGITLALAPPVVELGYRGVRWGQAHPLLFFAFAFFISYQVATLFFDIRDVVGGLAFARLR